MTAYEIIKNAHKRAIARRARQLAEQNARVCKTCGIRPRKISASGKELMWCDQCAKEYWRKKKEQKNARKT